MKYDNQAIKILTVDGDEVSAREWHVLRLNALNLMDKEVSENLKEELCLKFRFEKRYTQLA